LRFAFFLLFFCFEVWRSQPRPKSDPRFEGQRPSNHSCAAGGEIVSLENAVSFMERALGVRRMWAF